ncbi:MAG: 4a-hydroxytetrahydrobiopterin dehydratase [Bacteroidota bacterium]|mgnify:FL=1|nr:4a-hydroxytetrahydrobiopterin dehydratase [Bacteroidota bacterium]|tara:strand:- start:302 stop:532 length:231 start_codon:yes stop_codon:yes gene_type:complete
MWTESDNKLNREFKFKDFNEAISFINRIAVVSEESNHHPEIYNVYNKVIISLCTHDQGSVVTDKDYDLAKKIDDLL